jgi:nicotinate (nicotinamide) nucleotide adenylyltransferase
MEKDTQDEVAIHTAHLKAPREGRKSAVLFFNGTFTPIHKGHVDVLTTAKKYIEGLKEGYDVIGAYMSPCSPRYAAKKLKDETVDLKHRLAMARLAVSCHDWVYVDDYESTLPRQYRQFWLLLHNFHRRLLESQHEHLQSEKFEIFYLVGNDIRGNVPPQTMLKFMHVCVVINREDDTCHGLAAVKEKISHPERLHVVISENIYNMSSTAVRRAVRSDATLEELNSLVGIPSVAEYILQRKLWHNLPKIPLPVLPVSNTNAVNVTTEEMDISPRKGRSASSSNASTPTKSPNANKKRKISDTTTLNDSSWPYSDISDITSEVFMNMIKVHWPHIHVKDFISQQIGKGVGFGGKVYKLSGFITAKNNDNRMEVEQINNDLGEDLWTSFVVKLSLGVWNNKKTVAEPHFYQHLAPLIKSIALPKCFFSSIHESTCRSTLLLEDLSYLQFVNVKKQPLTKNVALSALRAVAKLHAEWWKSPKLNEFDWLPALNDPSTKTALTSKYNANWKQISQHLSNLLSEKAFDTCATLALVFPSVLDELMKGPVTLCHGDYWLGNMMFSDKWRKVHMIDFQSVCRGNPLIDVAFFLYYQAAPDLLKEIEDEVLQDYHNTLTSHGVTEFTFDECKRYYDLCKSYACVLGMVGVSIRGVKMQVYKNKTISLTPKFKRLINTMENVILPL